MERELVRLDLIKAEIEETPRETPNGEDLIFSFFDPEVTGRAFHTSEWTQADAVKRLVELAKGADNDTTALLAIKYLDQKAKESLMLTGALKRVEQRVTGTGPDGERIEAQLSSVQRSAANTQLLLEHAVNNPEIIDLQEEPTDGPPNHKPAPGTPAEAEQPVRGVDKPGEPQPPARPGPEKTARPAPADRPRKPRSGAKRAGQGGGAGPEAAPGRAGAHPQGSDPGPEGRVEREDPESEAPVSPGASLFNLGWRGPVEVDAPSAEEIPDQEGFEVQEESDEEGFERKNAFGIQCPDKEVGYGICRPSDEPGDK